MPVDSPAVLGKRSRSGCETCRARRVKCDEHRPVCEHCTRLQLPCGWDEVRPQQRRKRKSCEACRVRKSRCIVPTGDRSRERCEATGIECIWASPPPSPTSLSWRDTSTPGDNPNTNSDGARARTSLIDHDVDPPLSDPPGVTSVATSDVTPGSAILLQPPPSAATSSWEGGGLPDHPRFTQLLDKYFETVHYHGFLTFIHRQHFTILLRRGRVIRELPLLMAACTARLGAQPPMAGDIELGDTWADSALQTLLPNIYRNFGAENIMAVVLAHVYENSRGNYSSGWLLAGNAARMMQLLHLHTFDETYRTHLPRNLSPLLQPEALRRLAWSTFYIDAMLGNGPFGIRCLTEDLFTIQLPSREVFFLGDEQVTTEGLHEGDDGGNGPNSTSVAGGGAVGLSGWLVRTAAARRRVIDLTNEFKDTTKTIDRLETEVVAMTADLDSVIRGLPRRLQYSDDNLVLSRDCLPAFLLLHVMRHDCFLNIARLHLCMATKRPGGLDTPTSDKHRMDRITHAVPLSRIIAEGLRRGISLDPQIGVVAYVALEILLLEPPRLAPRDPTIDPKSPVYTEAMVPLLTILRLMGHAERTKSRLHVEACHRMVCLGLQDLLTEEDWLSVRRETDLIRPYDGEFDFAQFSWTDIERTDKFGHAQPFPGSLLDPNMGYAAPSAAPSPPGELDASFTIGRVDATSPAPRQSGPDMGTAGSSLDPWLFLQSDDILTWTAQQEAMDTTMFMPGHLFGGSTGG